MINHAWKLLPYLVHKILQRMMGPGRQDFLEQLLAILDGVIFQRPLWSILRRGIAFAHWIQGFGLAVLVSCSYEWVHAYAYWAYIRHAFEGPSAEMPAVNCRR